MSTLLRHFPFRAKRVGVLRGTFPVLCLRPLLCLFQSSAIASHTWAHTLKKIEVGFSQDSKNRARFACRWPSLESDWLSTRQHGCVSLWVPVTRVENGWLAVLLQFLKHFSEIRTILESQFVESTFRWCLTLASDFCYSDTSFKDARG